MYTLSGPGLDVNNNRQLFGDFSVEEPLRLDGDGKVQVRTPDDNPFVADNVHNGRDDRAAGRMPVRYLVTLQQRINNHTRKIPNIPKKSISSFTELTFITTVVFCVCEIEERTVPIGGTTLPLRPRGNLPWRQIHQ